MVSSSLSNKASQLFSPVEQKESEKDYSKIHNLHLKQTVHKDFVKYLQLKYCLLPNFDPYNTERPLSHIRSITHFQLGIKISLGNIEIVRFRLTHKTASTILY